MTKTAIERTALYRLFAEDDTLLYVGITVEPKTRLWNHANEKSWWGEVARQEIEWFADRPALDEWAGFGKATKAMGITRAAAVREFIRWYMRRPGAKLPERPPVGPWTRSANACNAPGDAPNSSGKERCELPAGHAGRHYEGITTWPQKRPVGGEEKTP